MGSAWTDEKIAALVEQWGAASASVIGKDIGISRNAVIGKAHRLGLAGQPSPIKRETRPKAQPKPKVPPRRPRLAVMPSAGVPLVDATERQCRYPVAGEGRALVVCGRPAHAIGDWRSAFCEGHHARCYQPPGTHTPRRSVSPQPRSI